MSLEQEIRIRKGKHAAECALCRAPARVVVDDETKRWWLTQYGVTDAMLAGRSASRYVAEEGLPEALRPIAASACEFLDA